MQKSFLRLRTSAHVSSFHDLLHRTLFSTHILRRNRQRKSDSFDQYTLAIYETIFCSWNLCGQSHPVCGQNGICCIWRKHFMTILTGEMRFSSDFNILPRTISWIKSLLDSIYYGLSLDLNFLPLPRRRKWKNDAFSKQKINWCSSNKYSKISE